LMILLLNLRRSITIHYQTTTNINVLMSYNMTGQRLGDAVHEDTRSGLVNLKVGQRPMIRPNKTRKQGIPIAELPLAVGIKKGTATATKTPDVLREVVNSTQTLTNQQAFYQSHHKALSRQPVDNMMVWNTKGKTHKLGRYWGLWQHLDYFHWSEEEDPPMPMNGASHSPMHYSIMRVDNSICRVAKYFERYYKYQRDNNLRVDWKHVLITSLNQDFGAFSASIPNKTGHLKDTHEEWKSQNCTPEMILDYMDHPNTLAVFTSQHQILNHPKVYSLPLGILTDRQAKLILQRLQQRITTISIADRPQLLMVNSKRRYMRAEGMDAVIKRFRKDGIPLHNTYSRGKPQPNQPSYLEELQMSKFILSPSGVGLDCYRHWEALLSGCIPVLETLNRSGHDGFYRSFDNLHVAWIDSCDHLTPVWLEQEYERLVLKQPGPYDYDWKKLTKQWWIELIQSHVVPDGKSVVAR